LAVPEGVAGQLRRGDHEAFGEVVQVDGDLQGGSADGAV
jgi:hypothetical protein